jgi:sugar phosphate isomerase/epimerase
MFRIGLNPYGLAYAVGLLGAGTARANPDPIGLRGFLGVAREISAACVEIDARWLVRMSSADLAALADELGEEERAPIVSAGLTHEPRETLEAAIRCARELRAATLRLGLTPVLEGARSEWGEQWREMAAHAARTLVAEAPRAADAGLTIAIEDHQDFGSEELIAMAEAAGPNVGITLDTGNPFAVGEDPVAFARRVAPLVRHVHLKDYRASFTDEGYRLVRCATGDGAVPFADIAATLAVHHTSLTASIEPGALEARHIRLFTPAWWHGYGPREAAELATAIGRLRARQIPDEASRQTPWERGAAAREIVEYELSDVRRSAANMRGEA